MFPTPCPELEHATPANKMMGEWCKQAKPRRNILARSRKESTLCLQLCLCLCRSLSVRLATLAWWWYRVDDLT
jgi:hypothetical protein